MFGAIFYVYKKEVQKMNDLIELKLITREDAECLHKLQIEAFMPLYEKYQDDATSPAKESLETITKKIVDDNSDFYFILFNGEKAGAVRVKWHKGQKVHKNVNWISPIFVIPKFQNKGIASNVIKQLFDIYPNTIEWWLSTIKQEEKNCHLYEKCGFVRTGDEIVVNENMTLVFYVKSYIEVRRFKKEDAKEVRNLIVRNFLEVNSKDYGISAMEKLAKAYNAEKVLNVASYAHMYVFEFDGKIIGTGSISSFWGSETESILLSIFVLPEFHGKGVGRKIINTLETDEFYVRASRIEIPASITATEFYRKFKKAGLKLQQIINYFYLSLQKHHETRKLDNAGCFSFGDVKYETSTALANAEVEIAYDPMNTETIKVVYQDMKPIMAHRVSIGAFCDKTVDVPVGMTDKIPETSRFLDAME